MTQLDEERPSSYPFDINYEEFTTLRDAALTAAQLSTDEMAVTARDLADRGNEPIEIIHRQFHRLCDGGYLERLSSRDGHRVVITTHGRQALVSEYGDDCRLFASDGGTTVTGTVTSGMGKGRHYVSLPGYVEQFRTRLGYEPFPGTLNIELDGTTMRFDDCKGIAIDAWKDDGQTYGAATCYPTTVEHDGERYEPAHILVPDLTDHGLDVLEIIATKKLRETLNLADGDEVIVYVS